MASNAEEPTAGEPTHPPVPGAPGTGARGRRDPVRLPLPSSPYGLNRQALDTDNWTDTSTELLENRTIRDQVALFLVDELYTNVDVAGVIERGAATSGRPAGGSRGERAEGPHRGSREDLPGEAARTGGLAEREPARPRAPLPVIDGGGEVLSTEDRTVTLDLKALLGATAENVGVGGRVESKLPEGAAQITI